MHYARKDINKNFLPGTTTLKKNEGVSKEDLTAKDSNPPDRMGRET
jgi:hypothetical protein